MSLSSCPDCGAYLTGAPACPTCGLRLSGPVAVRLYEVDLRLQALEGERGALLAERAGLLASLRAPVAAAAVPPPPPAPRPEASPRSVQNTLLGLGALLLALAGIVFTAVTYSHLGVVGRAAVLLALTAAAGTAPRWLLARGLSSSAEAVGAVAVVLSVLNAFALRKAGFLDDVDASSWGAGAALVLTLVGAAWARAVPLRVGRVATCLAAQAPVLFLLDRFGAGPTTAAVVLAALALADLAAADRAPLPQDVRLVLAGLGGLATLSALLTSVGAAVDEQQAAGLGFVAVAVVVAAAGLRRAELRAPLTGSVVPLLATAAWVTVHPDLADRNEPLVGSAVALLAVSATALLPRAFRPGPVVGTGVVAAATLVALLEPVLEALAGPFSWLVDPWSPHSDRARLALVTDQAWHGSGVTPVVLAAAAVVVVGAALLLDRPEDSWAPAGVLLALAALVLPLGLDASYDVAVGVLVATAAAVAAAGLRRRELHLLAALPAALACAWSLADEATTLVVLPVVAVLAGAIAVREEAATSVAALLGGAVVAAYGASRDLRADEVGLLLLLAPAVCVALSFVLRRVHLEVAAVALASVAVLLTTEDAWSLTWSLAGSGVLALAVAVRPDRRPVGLLGGLLLSASSWVRLAEADVRAPEPYVAPLAAAALVFGWLRRRQTGCSSFEAYTAGLSLALVPSLLRSFDDATATRGLLLLVVCVGLVLVGTQERLQAPLVIGGAVLVADGLHLLAPYASALPRWSLLALAGGLLVTVGATYEQRLRDVARMRERFDSWA